MRRLAVVLGVVAAALAVSSPAYAYAHDRVANPYLHAVLDMLTLAVATSPLWTAFLWRSRPRGLLLALVAVVQVPVAVIGFVPIANPAVHLAAFGGALGLTALSLRFVHPAAPVTVPAHR